MPLPYIGNACFIRQVWCWQPGFMTALRSSWGLWTCDLQKVESYWQGSGSSTFCGRARPTVLLWTLLRFNYILVHSGRWGRTLRYSAWLADVLFPAFVLRTPPPEKLYAKTQPLLPVSELWSRCSLMCLWTRPGLHLCSHRPLVWQSPGFHQLCQRAITRRVVRSSLPQRHTAKAPRSNHQNWYLTELLILQVPCWSHFKGRWIIAYVVVICGYCI